MVGVGKIEVTDGVDSHAVVQGGGVDVDAFGNLGAATADELRPEEHARCGCRR